MKFFCRLLGHQWLMLGWYQTGHTPPSTVTGWKCARCKEQRNQQWDW